MSHAIILIDIDPDTGQISNAEITQQYNGPDVEVNQQEARDYLRFFACMDDEPNRGYGILDLRAFVERLKKEGYRTGDNIID